jgi:osmoprotectant transport system substrate-binding protein
VSRAALGIAIAGLSLLLGACGDANQSATAVQVGPGRRDTTAKQALPGSGRPLVTIGDKNYTEQFVLGELYAQALSAKGYSVVLNRDIGPTEVTLQALASGRLSMYPEYLATWNATIAHYKHPFHSLRAAYAAARRYAARLRLSLSRPTPFSDTTAIAVAESYAAQNGLRTIRDLRGVASNLTLGGPPQFEQTPTGLPALERAYGVAPQSFKPLAIGEQYKALDQGTVQAVDVQSSDGQLRSGSYTMLADPVHAFGWGQVIPVVPRQVLEAEGPAFSATIDRVSALLTLTAIRELNADVDIYGQDPATVAKRFLQAHRLLPAQG